MSTNDVFATAVSAMAEFVEVPLSGVAYHLDTWAHEVVIALDNTAQPAQSLLAWFYRLPDATLTYRHTNDGRTAFVNVSGHLGGRSWRLYSWFTGEDAAALCEHSDGEATLSVHRLRAMQMRQTAAAVGGAR